jgi:hypothetical protein
MGAIVRAMARPVRRQPIAIEPARRRETRACGGPRSHGQRLIWAANNADPPLAFGTADKMRSVLAGTSGDRLAAQPDVVACNGGPSD